MELVKDKVRVELITIGEGLHGDYNADDPEDVELLRFYVEKKDDNEMFNPIEDGSYCTLLPASLDREDKMKALHLLMDVFYEPVMKDQSIKKLGERMSHFCELWF